MGPQPRVQRNMLSSLSLGGGKCLERCIYVHSLESARAGKELFHDSFHLLLTHMASNPLLYYNNNIAPRNVLLLHF